jgi:dihydrofolate reductase
MIGNRWLPVACTCAALVLLWLLGVELPEKLGSPEKREGAAVRRIVAAEYLSLDGVMEDPGSAGEYEHRGWTVPYWNDDISKWQTDQLFASDALLLGRVTYDEFVASWPLRSGDPFTDRMNNLPKFVASTTLQEPLEWNATLLEGDVVDAVAKLKEQPGEDLLIYGSGALVNTLMPQKLIDEYRFMIYPLVLGTGKRFFRDGTDKNTLELKRAETASTGVTMLVCAPAS